MSLFAATLRALLPLFLLIGAGYLFKKRGILHAAHVPVLNGLVVNVTLPALIVNGLVHAPTLPSQAAALPLALLMAQAVCLGAAFVMGKVGRWPLPQRGALLVTGTFGNTGFLGYPITLALLPTRLPEAILLDQFGMTLALYTLAPAFGAMFGKDATGTEQKDAAKQALLRFVRSPLFLSIALGGVLRLTPWPVALNHLPAFAESGHALSRCLELLGGATTPIVLLALGANLRPGAAVRGLGKTLTACAVKLLLCPLAMAGACLLLHLHGDLRRVGVLMAAMPTAVMASVLCGENDLAGEWAVGVVCVGTLLSALSIPLLLSWLV